MKIRVYDVSDGNKLIHKDEDAGHENLSGMNLPRIGERILFDYPVSSGADCIAHGYYRVVDIEHEYGDKWDMTMPAHTTLIIKFFVERIEKN